MNREKIENILYTGILVIGSLVGVPYTVGKAIYTMTHNAQESTLTPSKLEIDVQDLGVRDKDQVIPR